MLRARLVRVRVEVRLPRLQLLLDLGVLAVSAGNRLAQRLQNRSVLGLTGERGAERQQKQSAGGGERRARVCNLRGGDRGCLFAFVLLS